MSRIGTGQAEISKQKITHLCRGSGAAGKGNKDSVLPKLERSSFPLVRSEPRLRLQETSAIARWKMRVSSVASFIRCLSANSARYKSVNCLLDSAAILCGEKSSGINRQRCFRTNSERAFRQGSGSARSGNVSPLLIRKKPSSLIGQVAVCLPRNQASTLRWS